MMPSPKKIATSIAVLCLGSLLPCGSAQKQAKPFGKEILSAFTMDPSYINLNHGSYGSVPKYVQAAQSKWREVTEMNPDLFFRYTVYDDLFVARSAVAKYVNANPEDLVFVENASEGMNAILQSLLVQGSGLLYLDLAYGMVQETLRYLQDIEGVSLAEVSTDDLFPITSKEDFESGLISKVRDALAQDPSLNLCSFSHITSIPAIILPIRELSEACHEAGATVMVDGAHALGQIPLDLPALGVDVYVSNGHKWLYTPKGSAFLWVTPALQGTSNPYVRGSYVYPVVISNEGQGESDYAKLFSYEGTKDYANWLAFPAALDWRANHTEGESDIVEYMHSLAVSGGTLLAQAWNTSVLAPPDLIAAMVNVALPSTFDCTKAGDLSKTLIDNYNTYVPAFSKSEGCYVRVSAQIYNDLTDFSYLADSILEILKDGGWWRQPRAERGGAPIGQEVTAEK